MTEKEYEEIIKYVEKEFEGKKKEYAEGIYLKKTQAIRDLDDNVKRKKEIEKITVQTRIVSKDQIKEEYKDIKIPEGVLGLYNRYKYLIWIDYSSRFAQKALRLIHEHMHMLDSYDNPDNWKYRQMGVRSDGTIMSDDEFSAEILDGEVKRERVAFLETRNFINKMQRYIPKVVFKELRDEHERYIGGKKRGTNKDPHAIACREIS